jgi:hypothetical protein
MKIKINKIRKIAENAFGKYVYRMQCTLPLKRRETADLDVGRPSRCVMYSILNI